jgi:hypothetical protein
MWQPPPGAASSGGPLMAEASMNGFHPSASYDYQMQPHQRYVAYPQQQQQQQQQPSQHHGNNSLHLYVLSNICSCGLAFLFLSRRSNGSSIGLQEYAIIV